MPLTESGALSHCGNWLRQHDHDRYLCCLFTDAERREALFALFAFVSEIARIQVAAAEPLPGLLRLQWWRDQVDGLAQSTAHSHPVIAGLINARDRFGLDATMLAALVEACQDAFDNDGAADSDLSMQWLQARATIVIPVALAILGHATPSARERAEAASMAWALVRDLLQAAGGRPVVPLPLRDQDRLRQAVHERALLARDHLDRVRQLRGAPYRPVAPLLLPARLAALYLKRLERADWNPLEPAVSAPVPLKAGILWWASVWCR